MQVFDAVFVLLLILSAVAGYRSGAIAQVAGLSTIILGSIVAWALASLASGFGRVVVVLMCSLIGIAALSSAYFAARRASQRILDRAGTPRAARFDALAGSAFSVTALIIVTWFLAVNLTAGPFASVSDALSGSMVVRSLATALPPPPRLIPALQSVVGHLGFPDTFVGIPPVPLPSLPPAPATETDPAAITGLRSSIEVLGSGCLSGKFNEGSGFVASAGYVVTSAHVVAGTRHQFLYDGERRYPAVLVALDPNIDVAVLRSPTFSAPALTLRTHEAPRGSGGAVVGFPAGYHPTARGAVVRGLISVLSRDIYDGGVVHRSLYELQVSVLPGDSGGPFVLPDGDAAGMVAYSSVLDATVSYAIPSAVLAPVVQAGIDQAGTVSSGHCATAG